MLFHLNLFQDFKEELESVVTDLLRSDRGGGHVIAQAIANVFSPTNRSGPHGVFRFCHVYIVFIMVILINS